MGRWVRTAAAAAILAALTAAAPAHAKTLKPFGHDCKAQDGVRFCPTVDPAQRVPSWDKTPIDVDVTLPARGSGPFPTIVMLHGFTGSKADFESPKDANGARYDNVWFAKRGYAVVNPSIRGFGGSCNDK